MKTQLSKSPKQIGNREVRETISTGGPESLGSEASRVDPEADSAPGREEIKLLAYRYWQERGCPIGSPEEDWNRAERELASRSNTIH